MRDATTSRPHRSRTTGGAFRDRAELARAEDQAAALSCQFDDIVGAAELSNTDDEDDPEEMTIAHAITGQFAAQPIDALSRGAEADAGWRGRPAFWGLRTVCRADRV